MKNLNMLTQWNTISLRRLEKGESCVYTTHVGDDGDDDDDIIEQSMTKFGITVEKYKKNHVLNMRMMTHTPADSKGLRQRT